MDAAFDRQREALDRVHAVRKTIIATRATTFDGLRVKAKFAAERRVNEEEDVVASILADLLAT